MRAESWRRRRSQDLALWQRSRDADAAENEAERFLDLAGFVDGRLDAEDRERIAELLARDPAISADIAAARALATGAVPAASDTVVERAAALVDAAPRGQLMIFPPRSRAAANLQRFAQWGSLAAAIVMAGWLGFALGADASISLTRNGVQSEDGFLRELLDPSTGFLRDLTEGVQT